MTKTQDASHSPSLFLPLLAAALLTACGNSDDSPATNASVNPLATSDQLAAEKRAIEIVASADVIAAKAALKAQWQGYAAAIGGIPDEAQATLQAAVDESVFSSALGIISADAAAPKTISILAAPHEWGGVKVPGSRTTFDNPDTIYRYISIDPAGTYVIKGHRHAQGPIDQNFSLWDAKNNTLSNLTGDSLVVDSAGNYTITVDSTEATGSGNHIQLQAGAARIFVRDTINDWGVQQFDSLSVTRTDAGAAADTRTTATLAAQVAQGIGNGAVFAYYEQLSHATPVNTLPPVTLGGSAGRLASQAGTYSAFKLADDEALVLTVHLGGARYFIAPVYDRWFITTDYVNHTQTLNNKQALANADGTYTFVISPTDPGVYNWVDTVGIHDGFLNLRWQGLPATASADAPAAAIQLVKLADLASALPAGTKYVSAAERKAQLAARATSYAARYTQ
jgi:hypothetical protein